LVVLEGTVHVQVGEDRLEKGAGEFLGELSLLVPGLTHTTRVQAATPVRFLAIRRDDFEELLREHPTIAVAMLPVLARRQAETMSHL
jgi:CRP-like cAMP-binding protein